MNLYNHANRILLLNDHEELLGVASEKQNQKRLQVKNDKMIMKSVIKSKFAQLNDKNFHFTNGVVFLHFSHPLLTKLKNLKEDSSKKIEKVILKK